MSAVGYDLQFAADAIWRVGLASLVLGAGLPVLYAVGVRALAWSAGGESGGARTRSHPIGAVLAVVIFLAVAYAIVAGLVYIVATGKGSNYNISFDHVIPEIVKTGS